MAPRSYIPPDQTPPEYDPGAMQRVVDGLHARIDKLTTSTAGFKAQTMGMVGSITEKLHSIIGDAGTKDSGGDPKQEVTGPQNPKLWCVKGIAVLDWFAVATFDWEPFNRIKNIWAYEWIFVKESDFSVDDKYVGFDPDQYNAQLPEFVLNPETELHNNMYRRFTLDNWNLQLLDPLKDWHFKVRGIGFWNRTKWSADGSLSGTKPPPGIGTPNDKIKDLDGWVGARNEGLFAWAGAQQWHVLWDFQWAYYTAGEENMLSNYYDFSFRLCDNPADPWIEIWSRWTWGAPLEIGIDDDKFVAYMTHIGWWLGPIKNLTDGDTSYGYVEGFDETIDPPYEDNTPAYKGAQPDVSNVWVKVRCCNHSGFGEWFPNEYEDSDFHYVLRDKDTDNPRAGNPTFQDKMDTLWAATGLFAGSWDKTYGVPCRFAEPDYFNDTPVVTSLSGGVLPLSWGAWKRMKWRLNLEWDWELAEGAASELQPDGTFQFQLFEYKKDLLGVWGWWPHMIPEFWCKVTGGDMSQETNFETGRTPLNMGHTVNGYELNGGTSYEPGHYTNWAMRVRVWNDLKASAWYPSAEDLTKSHIAIPARTVILHDDFIEDNTFALRLKYAESESMENWTFPPGYPTPPEWEGDGWLNRHVHVQCVPPNYDMPNTFSHFSVHIRMRNNTSESKDWVMFNDAIGPTSPFYWDIAPGGEMVDAEHCSESIKCEVRWFLLTTIGGVGFLLPKCIGDLLCVKVIPHYWTVGSKATIKPKAAHASSGSSVALTSYSSPLVSNITAAPVGSIGAYSGDMIFSPAVRTFLGGGLGPLISCENNHDGDVENLIPGDIMVVIQPSGGNTVGGSAGSLEFVKVLSTDNFWNTMTVERGWGGSPKVNIDPSNVLMKVGEAGGSYGFMWMDSYSDTLKVVVSDAGVNGWNTGGNPFADTETIRAVFGDSGAGGTKLIAGTIATSFDVLHEPPDGSGVLINDSGIAIYDDAGNLIFSAPGGMGPGGVKPGIDQTWHVVGTANIDAGANINLTAGAAIDMTAGTKINMTAGGEINLDSAASINATASAEINLTAGGSLNCKASTINLVGDSAITVDSDGAISVTGGSISVASAGTLDIESAAAMNVQANSSLNMKATATLTLESNSAVDLDGTNLNFTSSSQVNLDAGADVVIDAGGDIVINAGNVRSGDYVVGGALKGWCITGEGNADFANIRARGRLEMAVMSYEAVNCVGGSLLVAPASVLAMDLGNNEFVGGTVSSNITDITLGGVYYGVNNTVDEANLIHWYTGEPAVLANWVYDWGKYYSRILTTIKICMFAHTHSYVKTVQVWGGTYTGDTLGWTDITGASPLVFDDTAVNKTWITKTFTNTTAYNAYKLVFVDDYNAGSLSIQLYEIQGFTAAGATDGILVTVDDVFNTNDFVILKLSATQVEYIKVLSDGAGTGDGGYWYSCLRSVEGTTRGVWKKGAGITRYANSSTAAGFIKLSSGETGGDLVSTPHLVLGASTDSDYATPTIQYVTLNASGITIAPGGDIQMNWAASNPAEIKFGSSGTHGYQIRHYGSINAEIFEIISSANSYQRLYMSSVGNQVEFTLDNAIGYRGLYMSDADLGTGTSETKNHATVQMRTSEATFFRIVEGRTAQLFAGASTYLELSGGYTIGGVVSTPRFQLTATTTQYMSIDTNSGVPRITLKATDAAYIQTTSVAATCRVSATKSMTLTANNTILQHDASNYIIFDTSNAYMRLLYDAKEVLRGDAAQTLIRSVPDQNIYLSLGSTKLEGCGGGDFAKLVINSSQAYVTGAWDSDHAVTHYAIADGQAARIQANDGTEYTSLQVNRDWISISTANGCNISAASNTAVTHKIKIRVASHEAPGTFATYYLCLSNVT